jgi:hypothetical protein
MATDGRLVVHWTESCGIPARKPPRKGFGTSVIQQMIRQQFNGLTAPLTFLWSSQLFSAGNPLVLKSRAKKADRVARPIGAKLLRNNR